MSHSIVNFTCRNCKYSVIWHHFEYWNSTICPRCGSENTNVVPTDRYLKIGLKTTHKTLFDKIIKFINEKCDEGYKFAQIRAMIKAQYDVDIPTSDIRQIRKKYK